MACGAMHLDIFVTQMETIVSWTWRI